MNTAHEASVVIRDISDITEIIEVETLQKEVWGIPDIEVVPASHLVASIAAGGILIGAFEGERAVGFAYGFVGLEDGRNVHHSHMLAVSPALRGQDVGFRLKAAQRDRVTAQGIELMSWTFDPLQSLNANFNFNKLGVFADRYFVNFYGEEAGSFLHQNGTDRLWVTWPLLSESVIAKMGKMSSPSEFSSGYSLVRCGDDLRPKVIELEKNVDKVSIDIPLSIGQIEAADMGLAAEWRQATRTAFTSALADGFRVEGFQRSAGHGTYFLSRK